MKLRYLFVLLGMTCTGLAQAEIYKYTDPEGHVTYSSTPMRGAKKLNLEALPTTPAPGRSHTESETAFPRVTEKAQRNRDDTRRRILDDELATEQKLLDAAQQKLRAAKDTPMVYRGKDGKTYRNVNQYNENVKSAEAEVSMHEKNVQALQTELSQLK